MLKSHTQCPYTCERAQTTIYIQLYSSRFLARVLRLRLRPRLRLRAVRSSVRPFVRSSGRPAGRPAVRPAVPAFVRPAVRRVRPSGLPGGSLVLRLLKPLTGCSEHVEFAPCATAVWLFWPFWPSLDNFGTRGSSAQNHVNRSSSRCAHHDGHSPLLSLVFGYVHGNKIDTTVA